MTRGGHGPLIWTGRMPAKSQFETGSKPPIGCLWWAVDDAWLSWCEGDMPDWVGEHFYDLHIDESKILIIGRDMTLEQFHHKYSVPSYPGAPSRSIDWARVAEHYSGIEIPEYSYQHRLEIGFLWYYGWDVASGVIWDAAALRDITKIERPRRVQSAMESL